MNKKVIGRTDKIDFPELRLANVKAKIDSGAFYSAIHCDQIRSYRYAGKEKLKVVFLDPANDAFTGKEYVFEEFRVKTIKSSNGIVEKRYVVDVAVEIFGEIYQTPFSLTNREMLKYPILLGRQLLNENFVIDTSQFDISFNLKNNL